MTTYSSREELVNLVVTRHRSGWSKRKLAKALGVSRNTVSKILKDAHKQQNQGHDPIALSPKRVPRGSKLDKFVPEIESVLEEYPGLSGQRIFEKLQSKGYDGGITILRDRLQLIRPKPKRNPVVRFETEPGKQGQMDWSPYRVKRNDGGLLRVVCFSYILGFSRRQFVDFAERRDFHSLIRRHRATFEHFGGTPEQCLYDSEKTVVLRWEANQPIFNPSFLQFATHYNFRPVACQRGNPRTKGKVERPFQYIENNLLGGRKFDDLDDLRHTARWWMANRSDTHIHDTTRRAPLELFLAEEACALQPLPLHPYDTSEIGLRVCSPDAFVEWETNRYSVPFEHVGEIVTAKVTENEVIIFGPDLCEIARHERRPDGSHTQIELPEHRTQSKKIRYGLEPVRETFLALGKSSEAFLAGLVLAFPRNSGYHARFILQLKETYQADDIHKALLHAMRYRAYDCMAVQRILKARFVPRTLEQTIREKSAERLRAALPCIEQRGLDEYEVLLEADSDDTPTIEEDTCAKPNQEHNPPDRGGDSDP